MTSHLSDFEKLREFYPGSTKEIVRKPRKAARDLDGWDSDELTRRVLKVQGEDREFFTVGALAKALGRRPVTIRAWERKGVIPKPTFRRPGATPEGNRRLYTREQISGMVRIATEEGLMRGENRGITSTDFTARVLNLFRELAAT